MPSHVTHTETVLSNKPGRWHSCQLALLMNNSIKSAGGDTFIEVRVQAVRL